MNKDNISDISNTDNTDNISDKDSTDNKGNGKNNNKKYKRVPFETDLWDICKQNAKEQGMSVNQYIMDIVKRRFQDDTYSLTDIARNMIRFNDTIQGLYDLMNEKELPETLNENIMELTKEMKEFNGNFKNR